MRTRNDLETAYAERKRRQKKTKTSLQLSWPETLPALAIGHVHRIYSHEEGDVHVDACGLVRGCIDMRIESTVYPAEELNSCLKLTLQHQVL